MWTVNPGNIDACTHRPSSITKLKFNISENIKLLWRKKKCRGVKPQHSGDNFHTHPYRLLQTYLLMPIYISLSLPYMEYMYDCWPQTRIIYPGLFFPVVSMSAQSAPCPPLWPTSTQLNFIVTSQVYRCKKGDLFCQKPACCSFSFGSMVDQVSFLASLLVFPLDELSM